MTSIRITSFGGMRKRNSRGLQNPDAASLARDVKLWHGTIAPWRYPALIEETNLEQVCKIYKQNCCILVSDNNCASFTKGDPACENRVFSTGVMPWPAYATLPDCPKCDSVVEPQWCRLGVPKPATAPTIIESDPIDSPEPVTEVDYSYQEKREPRGYAYSFVNDYGEEGELSPTSSIIDIDTDGSATIGFNVPPNEDYCLEYIRIYRLLPLENPEIMDNVDQNNPATSAYFLVGEIDYQTGNITFVDDVAADLIEDPHSESCATPPLPELQNIRMTNSGSLVASEGRNLWFSEPWEFHSWSCFMTFDYCIEAIAVTGNNIYVITNGKAYVLNDSVNEEECKCCRSVAEMNEPTPIACKNTLVETPTGVIFATHDGLVRIAGNGLQYISLGFYGSDQWGEWFPHNMHSAYYKGQYFGFNSSRGFIYDVSEGFYTDRNVGEETHFSELSLTPNAVFATSQGELLMSFGGGIYQWDASDTYLPYTWRSKLNVEGGTTNLGYGKIVFENWIGRRPAPNPVMFTLYADDRVVFRRRVNSSQIFTLPRGYDSLNFEIEVEGVETIMEIHLASTKRELTLLNNT